MATEQRDVKQDNQYLYSESIFTKRPANDHFLQLHQKLHQAFNKGQFPLHFSTTHFDVTSSTPFL